MFNQKQSVLRPHIVPPRAALDVHLKTAYQQIAFYRLQDEIWRELLNHLRHPIKLVPSKKHHIVEVLGCIRYYLNRETGEIHSSTKSSNGLFERMNGKFIVDPPFLLTRNIFRHFISRWHDELVQISDNPQWIEAFEKSLLRAVKLSVYSKRLRYQVFEALKIEPEIIHIARLARIVRHERNLHNEHFNLVARHRILYKQLHREAPHLLWLYTLTLQHGLELPAGEMVQSLKALCLNVGCHERDWRLIVRSHLRDFESALETGGNKWCYFIEYVQLHRVLDRNLAIPRKVAHLFTDPCWNIKKDGTILYRDVPFHPVMLNSYINEALKQNDVNAFMTSDATAVFAWLSEAKPQLDSNQRKLGWQWLLREANHWLIEQATHDNLITERWECGLGETIISGYQFVPLSNAWLVRQEALRYRHCVDDYVGQCKTGQYRVYSVHDKHGKHKATLGLQHDFKRGWQVNQIRGFANKIVSPKLKHIAETISAGLNLVDDGPNSLNKECKVIPNEVKFTQLRCGNAYLNLDDDNDGHLCPICKEEDGCCEHIVACFDRYDGSIAGGEVYDKKDQWDTMILTIFQYCIDHSEQETGLGDDFDQILSDIEQDARDGQGTVTDLVNTYSQVINRAICRLISDDADVYITKVELDEIPGMSTVYDTYWASNPAEVIQRVDEIIGVKVI